jgi:MFS family permease
MTATTAAPASAARSGAPLVIGASALGTTFEWYDFYLYGSLASVLSRHFFAGLNETTAYIYFLATLAVGFIVRPLGALVFGRIGDIVGRKTTFLVTLALMGGATVAIGLLPGYAAIGPAAPLILVGLRIVQGLALGGEFGGAITYVAEHAPEGRRGLYAGFIPATAMSGLLLSLLVIAATRESMPVEDFEAWGWRIPFLASIILLGVSLWIRLKLDESPVFQQMRAEAATSRTPLAELFLRWDNLKRMLIALFGVVAGQAVVFYAATFYALYFLERTAKVDGLTASLLMAAALVIGAPLTAGAGWLADRVGRKPVLLAGLALAALLFLPLFTALQGAANPQLAAAQVAAPVVVRADPAECSLQFDPLGRNAFQSTSCDIVKSYLAGSGVRYASRPLDGGGPAQVDIGGVSLTGPDPAALAEGERASAIAAFREEMGAALAAAGYLPADPDTVNRPLVVAILAALLAFAAMCTGAYASLLAELFPARIRYSAVSFPQNFGNGWFGGFLPAAAFSIVAATGDVFAGLWYPVTVAAGTFVIGLVFLPETRGRPLQSAAAE